MHILIALFSVGFTSYIVFRPSRTKLQISYGLLAATLGSGCALIVVANAPMLKTCMSGLAYTALVSAGIALASRRLQTQESRN